MGGKIPTLVLFLCIFSAAVAADYVRPQPRETPDFPWDRKPSSYPHSAAGEGLSDSRAFFFLSIFRFESPLFWGMEFVEFAWPRYLGRPFLLNSLRSETVTFLELFAVFLKLELLRGSSGGEDCEMWSVKSLSSPYTVLVDYVNFWQYCQFMVKAKVLNDLLVICHETVHISLAGEGHMHISWVTDGKSSPSYMEYGTSPGRYDSTAQGESTSYSYLFYSSGRIHHTVIGPLESNTVYFYRCGGEGPEFQLKTPPTELLVAFAVAGDLGQTGWTKTALDHIDQCKYDVHLLAGDLSYADCIQHRWDTFGELVQPLASARLWMGTQGNHGEESSPLIKYGFQSYNARWKMRYEECGSSLNLYYFEVAGFHVIVILHFPFLCHAKVVAILRMRW
ncbi:hypothetical protein EUGRSUZ_F00774 [Eucalyptus grandis]|uniref:Purple acid phosphatase N-terminal domain-containing protein n=2 Tax=Eucalyptus grandis TaxID=71139 RepID=A0A059BMC4_EUCGR|nr:hypothetical protein EUGRSUZ_F00774 [Eucalyptus grandis]